MINYSLKVHHAVPRSRYGTKNKRNEVKASHLERPVGRLLSLLSSLVRGESSNSMRANMLCHISFESVAAGPRSNTIKRTRIVGQRTRCTQPEEFA